MEKITIKDIARICSVSPATVSRVMSNNSRISKKTKDKVNKIIKELGYTPNSMAQNLINKSTNIIGVVIQSDKEDTFSNSFFIEMMTHLSNLFMNKGYYLLYINCHNNKEEYKKVVELVKSKRIDGLVFLRLKNTDETLKFLSDIDFPFVVVGTPKDIKKILWVDNDNIKTTYDITDKLIKQGYKNILFLGGSSELEVTKYRYLGYKNAFLDNNLEVNNNNVLESEFNEYVAYDKIDGYIKNSDISIDAVVTTDDILAIGTVKALKNNKKKAKVIGFNDTLIRKYIEPKFATININVDRLANSCVELLIAKLNSEEIKYNFRVIETKYIEENE